MVSVWGLRPSPPVQALPAEGFLVVPRRSLWQILCRTRGKILPPPKWGRGVHQGGLWVQAALQVGVCPQHCPPSLSPPTPFSLFFLPLILQLRFISQLTFPPPTPQSFTARPALPSRRSPFRTCPLMWFPSALLWPRAPCVGAPQR